MASPQVEHGFTPFASELLRMLIRHELTGHQWRVLGAMALDSFGRRRKESYLSINEISQMTRIPKRGVCKALKQLVVSRMALPGGSALQGTTRKNERKINKDYDTWVVPYRAHSALQGTGGSALQGTGTNKAVINKRLKKHLPPKSPQGGVGPQAYPKPDYQAEPVRAMVYLYKLLKGFPGDDRGWDARHYGRCCKSAKALLAIFAQDFMQAGLCLQELAKDFEAKSLSWTLETVVRHADEWKLKEGKKNGLTRRSSVSVATPQPKPVRPGPQTGEFVAAGTVLNGLRNLPALRSATGPGDSRKPDRAKDASLPNVPGPSVEIRADGK